MDKLTNGNKRYSIDPSHLSLDYNTSNNHQKAKQRTQSEYFEFKAEDQVYSYAHETDGSNGTVSTYAEGRIGRDGTYDNNENVCHDTRKEESAKVKISNRYAQTEISSNSKILNRYAREEGSANAKISKRLVHSEKNANTKRVDGTDRTGNRSTSFVSYSKGYNRNQLVQAEPNADLSDSTRSTSTTYDKIIDTDIARQPEAIKSSTSNGCCSLGRCILAIVILVILTAAAVVLIYVYVINKQSEGM